MVSADRFRPIKGKCPKCGKEVKTWSCYTIHCPNCGTMSANYNLFAEPRKKQPQEMELEIARQALG